MSSATAHSAVPMESWGTLAPRQFAIAAGLSLLAHLTLLIVILSPGLEEAQLAGGGASFGLSGSGTGAGADTGSDSNANQSEALSQDMSDSDYMATEELRQQADQQTLLPDQSAARANSAAAQALAPARSKSQSATSSDQASTTASSTRRSGESSTRRSERPKSQDAQRAKASTGAPNSGSGNAGSSASASTQGNQASAGRSTKGTGTGTGSADGSGDSDTTNYGGLVLQHIQRNRRSNAAGAGRVRLKITIAPNGRVRNVAIAKTSGSTRFDRQAMRMVKMASPYPKPPPGQRPILVWITGS